MPEAKLGLRVPDERVRAESVASVARVAAGEAEAVGSGEAVVSGEAEAVGSGDGSGVGETVVSEVVMLSGKFSPSSAFRQPFSSVTKIVATTSVRSQLTVLAFTCCLTFFVSQPTRAVVAANHAQNECLFLHRLFFKNSILIILQ